MKNYSSITATAQGVIAYDLNGNAQMQRYEKTYQAKSAQKSPKVQATSVAIEKLHLNLIQRQMYRRLMYGLKEYAPEQVASMSPSIITKIVEDYKKAKRALHVLKAKTFYKNETNLIKAIFPHAHLGEKDHDWFLEIPKDITLKKLGISTQEVIEEFIRRRLLPKDFFSLTLQNANL